MLPAHGQPMSDGEACLEGSGRAQMDEAICRRALSRSDIPGIERSALLTARAGALANLGETDEALAEIGRALALNDGSANAYFLRGLLRRGGSGALDDLDRAIALNPYFVDALAQRGAVHMRSGAEGVALRDLEAALAINPRSSAALFYKGVLRFRQGRFALAEALFRRVLALSPIQHPIASLWLAAAVGRQGRDGAAEIAPYRWWWQDELWPAPLVALWAGDAAPDAVGETIRTLRGDQGAQGAFFLGQWYLSRGRAAAAQGWLDRAVRLGAPYLPEIIAIRPVPSD